MTRFKAGDRVKISGVVTTPFAGLEGTVEDVLPYPHEVKDLDKYTVLFSWGEKQAFYDVQLNLIEHNKRSS